jgi:hypothetical protein
MKDHELKLWPTFFWPTMIGVKTFEYRINDRDFQVGDTLWLREWDPGYKTYLGRNIRVLVTHIWSDIPGVPEDYLLMEIRVIQAPWDIKPK